MVALAACAATSFHPFSYNGQNTVTAHRELWLSILLQLNQRI